MKSLLMQAIKCVSSMWLLSLQTKDSKEAQNANAAVNNTKPATPNSKDADNMMQGFLPSRVCYRLDHINGRPLIEPKKRFKGLCTSRKRQHVG